MHNVPLDSRGSCP